MKIREPTLQDNIAKNYTNNNTKLLYINKKNGINSFKVIGLKYNSAQPYRRNKHLS